MLTAAEKASTNEENVGDEKAVGDEDVVGDEEEIYAFMRPNSSHKPSCPVMPPFVKKIHTISLRERLLKASDNGSRTAKHPSSNSPKGRVGLDAPTNSPIRRVGPNMQSNSPVWRVGSVSLPSSRPRSSPLRD
ncbi:hypothetical protein F2Q70_00004309 [Brassica cretica]|uniref:Uncharacterized protein n=1 Tax=Brassica cretica TaxID=69181 RepID=A0A8S9FZ93_BRACR|nr:hypothetical protein F2Q68_00021225 [Brassica cretica]KAF2573352.1 hypothetical protein F2Q70_00004309 [Brassica cretica]